MPTTTNYGFTTPTEGGSNGTWDTILNAAIEAIDNTLYELAGALSDTMLIPAPAGSGFGWSASDNSYLAMTPAGSPGPLIVPILNLSVGQKITAFGSVGEAAGASAATVSLWFTDSSGNHTQVDAGHSLPGSVGATSTSVDHDIVAARGYYLKVSPSGTVGNINVRSFSVTREAA